MWDANPAMTPLDPNQKLSKEMSPKTTAERSEMERIPYRQALGSAMFACQGTRPDIACTITTLSCFSNDPGKPHWTALKRVYRYLKGTIHYKLEYSRDGNSNLIGYSDADWADDTDNRRSTTGDFILQGGAITWNSKRQRSVALSTNEAEYMAVSATAQEAIWLRHLLKEIKEELVEEPTVIYTDYQSAIKSAKNSAYRARLKHVDTRVHFIREK
ncbi:uncharacterized protein [Temnothorax nylanderi]|uniref:uncharacterized protein n=1 Tax=Temnothorax nylanderi TaxID=102681 RepID=UPI003A886B18